MVKTRATVAGFMLNLNGNWEANVSESLAKCVEAAGIGGNRGLRAALEAAPSLLKSDEVVLEAREGGAILPGLNGMGGLLVLLTDSRIFLLIPSGWQAKTSRRWKSHLRPSHRSASRE